MANTVYEVSNILLSRPFQNFFGTFAKYLDDSNSIGWRSVSRSRSWETSALPVPQPEYPLTQKLNYTEIIFLHSDEVSQGSWNRIAHGGKVYEVSRSLGQRQEHPLTFGMLQRLIDGQMLCDGIINCYISILGTRQRTTVALTFLWSKFISRHANDTDCMAYIKSAVCLIIITLVHLF